MSEPSITTIQVLRAIHLRPGLTARSMGLSPTELQPARPYLTTGYDYYQIRLKPLHVNTKGIELLGFRGALCLGNPEWDTPEFLEIICRESIHGD